MRQQEKIPAFQWNDVRKVVLQKHAVSWGKTVCDTSVMTAVC